MAYDPKKPFSSKIGVEDLAPPEYVEWKKKPGKDTMGALIKKMEPTINQALTSFAGPERDAMRTRAMILSADIIKGYSPDRKMKLTSYLMQNLQSLNRERDKRVNILHIPENALLIKNRIFHHKENFISEKGREPSIEELADAAGLSPREIERVSRYNTFIPSALATSEKQEFMYSSPRDKERIWADYVYFDLDPKDKKIFEWTTGYRGAHTISKGEIAKKLRMSPAAVSVRINRIIEKMSEGEALNV